MNCIRCGQSCVLLWKQHRARIYQCLGGHYFETVELVTGPVHDAVPFGAVPVQQIVEQPA